MCTSSLRDDFELREWSMYNMNNLGGNHERTRSPWIPSISFLRALFTRRCCLTTVIHLEAVFAMAIASNDPHPSVQRQRLSGLGRWAWELSGAPETSCTSSSDGWENSDSLSYIACSPLSSLEDGADNATDLMWVCGWVRRTVTPLGKLEFFAFLITDYPSTEHSVVFVMVYGLEDAVTSRSLDTLVLTLVLSRALLINVLSSWINKWWQNFSSSTLGLHTVVWLRLRCDMPQPLASSTIQF